MSAWDEQLPHRRAALLKQIATERATLTREYSRISEIAGRADELIGVAKRVTPIVAIGAIVAGFIIGPGRIIRLLRASAVPVLVVRQLLRGAGIRPRD